MRWLVEHVADCVDQAVRSMVSASARVATFEFDAKWCRNDRTNGGAYPDTVALAFDDERGDRIGTVLNYASHPETLWEKNKLISPDFIGPLRESIREGGGELVYFSGPLGAMLTPNCPPDSTPAQRLAYIEALGAALGQATISALDQAEELDGEVAHTRTEAVLKNENWRFRLLERLHLVDVKTEDGSVRSQVHHVQVGSGFSLVTAPGELCPEAGALVRSRLETQNAMVVCLAEDELGYLLVPAMFDAAEYGYETTMSLGRATLETLLATVEQLVPQPSAPQPDAE
jgi:hypothetical protein